MENQIGVLKRLRLWWAAVALGCLVYLGSAALLLLTWWSMETVLYWLLGASAVLVHLLWLLWRGLELNYRQGETALLPVLGAGNGLTVLRGVLASGLAGFLLSPVPTGALAWVPGVIYIAAGLADLFDGYLARTRNHVTRLGEMLDMSLDGMGVLLAVLLAIRYGQAPAWYIAVGLARYAYLLGIWVTKRLGRQVYELKPSPRRRAFAGAQMGVLGALLLPVFSPPAAHLAALAFAIPFLSGFLWDFLSSIGLVRGAIVIHGESHIKENIPGFNLLQITPLLLRGIVLILVSTRLWQETLELPAMISLFHTAVVFTPDIDLFLYFGFQVFGLGLVTLGAAGRLGSLFILLAAGLRQRLIPLSPLDVIVIISVAGLFFLGSGPFSLWKPEDYLIHHRLGDND